MAASDLTAQRLRELLDYDPLTGYFTRRLRTSNCIKIGERAGSLRNDGYMAIRVNRRCYLAHRLAWLYVHGAWPPEEIDHRNGIKDDNRLGNLRAVGRTVNAQNVRSTRSDNHCGLSGASWNRNRWRARIQANGKMLFLGCYVTAEEAHAVYLQAKRRLHVGCTI